jgi:hypothetical protein
MHVRKSQINLSDTVKSNQDSSSVSQKGALESKVQIVSTQRDKETKKS